MVRKAEMKNTKGENEQTKLNTKRRLVVCNEIRNPLSIPRCRLINESHI